MAHVVLAGGGTAGHTSPLIATAQQLSRLDPGSELLCVGTARGLETQVIPAAGLEVDYADPAQLPALLVSSAVAMLVNHLGRRGQSLPAGSLVLSGGITEAVAVQAGDNVTLRVQGMGSVGLRFA